MFIARQVQHTGVAPTDDSFTVIVPGKENSTKDGRTLVDDPDFGWRTAAFWSSLSESPVDEGA